MGTSEYGYPFVLLQNWRDFKTEEAWTYKDDRTRKLLELNEMPQEIKDDALATCEGRCILTGALIGVPGQNTEESAIVTWIFPPAFSYRWTLSQMYPEARKPDRFQTVGNALVMRKDLADLFQTNTFAIDVDRDFQIVVFDPSAEGKLPVTYVPEDVRGRLDANRLREHFHWTLAVYFTRGDITEDHSYHEIMILEEDLAEQYERGGGHVDLEDTRWSEGPGKEVLENFMARKMRKVPDEA